MMKKISTNYVKELRDCVTAVIVNTADGEIILANEQACALLGYTERQMRRIPIAKLVNDFECEDKSVADSSRCETGSLTGIKKDGTTIPMHFFSVPFTGNDGSELRGLTLVPLGDKPVFKNASFINPSGKITKASTIANAVLRARQTEREEIGRELHDNVNQILASAGLYLGIVKKESGDRNKHLEHADNLLKTAIDELRGISHSLIRPSLQKEEFLKALEDIINTTSTGTALSIDKEVTGFETKKVSEKLWLTVFRIIQEQFSNIIKYAGADKVSVKLAHEKQALLLSITDNGKGFDPRQQAAGIGLMNINSRATSNNGYAVINSSPGNGCELKVMFRLR